MRKIFILFICLSVLAISGTAFAEPTWKETVSFITEKIKKYSEDHDMRVAEYYKHTYIKSGWNCSAVRRDIYFRYGYIETPAYESKGRDANHVSYGPGDVVIRMRWSGLNSNKNIEEGMFPERDIIWVIKDFGNMNIGPGYGGSIMITDPQDKQTIIVGEDINPYPKITRSEKCLDLNNLYSTSTMTLYFTSEDISERVSKALHHLQKLHQEKYPNERKKEAF